ALAEKLYTAVVPTLKAGELDAVAELRGPTESKHYALIAALKLKDGQNLEKLLRTVSEQIPQAEREKLKLDAETAGSVKIHRLNIQGQCDEQAKTTIVSRSASKMERTPRYAWRLRAMSSSSSRSWIRRTKEPNNPICR